MLADVRSGSLGAMAARFGHVRYTLVISTDRRNTLS
jgi:hypothetical protein